MKNYYIFLDIVNYKKDEVKKIFESMIKNMKRKISVEHPVSSTFEFGFKVNIQDEHVDEIIDMFIKSKHVIIVEAEFEGTPKKIIPKKDNKTKDLVTNKKDLSRFLK